MADIKAYPLPAVRAVVPIDSAIPRTPPNNLEAEQTLPSPGTPFERTLAWDTRYAYMRMHTCMDLVSALLCEAAVTGEITKIENKCKQNRYFWVAFAPTASI